MSLVVWRDAALAPPGISGRIFDALGEPSGDAATLVSSGQDASAPDAAATADGFAVAWAGGGIQSAFSPRTAPSATRSPPPPPPSASAPALAATADGASLWPRGSRGEVLAQVLRDGARLADPLAISTEGAAGSAGGGRRSTVASQ